MPGDFVLLLVASLLKVLRITKDGEQKEKKKTLKNVDDGKSLVRCHQEDNKNTIRI